ncbi:MAG: hypothetical protein RI897_3597 [Verrucomicrobiota bacterium]
MGAGGDEDLHAEGVTDGGDGAADAAEAEDAEGFAVKFCQWGVAKGEVGALGPCACVDASGVVAGLEREFEEEGEHQLGD